MVAAILKALADLLWPLVAFYLIWILRPSINGIFENKNIKLKIGGQEVSIDQVAANFGAAVSDLQAKVSEISDDNKKFIINDKNETVIVNNVNTESIRILWVDDEPANNAFIVDRLRSENYIVDLSLSTDDALFMINNGPKYNCIITDLGRVEGGVFDEFAGMKFIEKVKNVSKNIPILVFSSSRAIKYRDQLIKIGAKEVTNSGVDVFGFVESCAVELVE